MNRTLKGRVDRLERGTGDPDQFYLMWCRPDEDEDEVLRQHAPAGAMDRMKCCHWKSAGPMPAPRWTTLEELELEELTYMLDSDKAHLVRSGKLTAEEINELEREIQDSPMGTWTLASSRVVARHAAKGTT